MSEVLYKIQSGVTGKFSTGGSTPGWNSVGKVWKRRGDLSSHFTNLDARGRKVYHDEQAVVVEIEMVCKNPIPVDEYIQAASDRAADREKARRDATAHWQRQRDLQELARLQSLYGKGTK